MPEPPLFTAAIICFNRRELVRDAIESVLRQEYADYELVLVDDASTDGSAVVLREYSDRATVVVREQNGGEMAARNTAMSVARGQYVCFLDDDDLWFPWTLTTFARAIERNGTPSMVGGAMLSFRADSELRNIEQREYVESLSSCYFSSMHYVGVASSAIRREEIERAGGFTDLRLNGLDTDLMLRIGDRPGFVKIESPLTFAYRQHANITGEVVMSYGGAMHVVQMETEGRYPGGLAFRADRLRHITRRTRNATFQFLRKKETAKVLEIYRRTFWWNVRMRRWGYLAMIPLMALVPPLRQLYKFTRD